MEKKTSDLAIVRPRSSRAAISDGYRLYVGHFRVILRASWVAAVVYALTMGLVLSVVAGRLPSFVIWGATGMAALPQFQSQMATTGLLLLGSLLLFSLAATVLASYGYSVLREQLASGSITPPTRWYGRLDKPALWRTLKAVLWGWLIVLAASFLLAGIGFAGRLFLGRLAAGILIVTAYLIVGALLLPLGYTLTKYVLRDNTGFVKTLSSTYSTGLRHWGALFIVTLVAALVIAILTTVTELPANILFAANLQSQWGALQGDPLGMPSYMGWMNFVVFCIAGFIQAYVHLSSLFPFAYLYGAIEAQEQERGELHKITEDA